MIFSEHFHFSKRSFFFAHGDNYIITSSEPLFSGIYMDDHSRLDQYGAPTPYYHWISYKDAMEKKIWPPWVVFYYLHFKNPGSRKFLSNQMLPIIPFTAGKTKKYIPCEGSVKYDRESYRNFKASTVLSGGKLFLSYWSSELKNQQLAEHQLLYGHDDYCKWWINGGKDRIQDEYERLTELSNKDNFDPEFDHGSNRDAFDDDEQYNTWEASR